MANEVKVKSSISELQHQQLYGCIADVMPELRYLGFIHTYANKINIREILAENELENFYNIIFKKYKIDITKIETLNMSTLYKIIFSKVEESGIELHCWNCNKTMPSINFSKAKSNKSGHRNVCKKCCYAKYDPKGRIKANKIF